MTDSDLQTSLRLALQSLLLVGKGASERGAVLTAAVSDPSLSQAKSAARNLVIATLAKQDLIDKIIERVLPNRPSSPRTRWLLRLAVQVLLQSRSDTDIRHIEKSFRKVTAVEQLPELETLVGSVLALDFRQIQCNLGDPERLALDTHHPSWWVSYCYRLLGRGEAVKLLSAAPRPRYIRINSLKNRGRTTLPAKARPLIGTLVKVAADLPIYAMPESASAFSDFFSQGLFQIQDLASFLAVKAADPAPGETALDLCAAPGGKTSALAQFMRNRGRIVSVDYSPTRMKAWKREVSRLGVKIAEPVVCNAAEMAVRGCFDLIVIDPPCTGTGIFDRHPSMKWHLTPESVDRYASLQGQFLDSASQLLAPDGRILYCTCSITLEENEQVVSHFLKSHPDFETRAILPEYGSPGIGLADCRRLWPHRDRTAGYFIARLQRVN